jgi:hypothetical protein
LITRFYEILNSLWRQMRNVMFTAKAPQTRRGGRPPIMPPAPMTDGEEFYMGDIDTDTASNHARARATATRKVESLAAEVTRGVAASRQRRWTADETDEALVDLITCLATIRAHSEPQVFAQLWETHIMRVDELEDEITAEAEAQAAAAAATPAAAARAIDSSPSNEPWGTHGNPTPHAFGSTNAISPALPEVMSVYLSVTRFANSVALPAPASIAAAPLGRAYLWNAAPVENAAFTDFFNGVNARIDVPSVRILA